MNRRTVRILAVGLLAVAALGATACGGSRTALQQLSAEELFERGQRDFERRRWDDAIRALERVVMFHPGHPRLEEAIFLLAEAHYNKREYDTAASEYTRLATAYPRGQYAEQARYRACRSYYNMSPRVELDQQNTKAAVDHCEAMVRVFPNSELAPRVNEMLTELRNKLGEKIYIGGDFYFRRRAYDSAILYFERVVAEHPSTTAAPRALLRLVQAYDRIGYEDEAWEAKQRLLRDYPDTEEAAAAREITLAEGG
jgi:outer membrane protein assembly factor BamD